MNKLAIRFINLILILIIIAAYNGIWQRKALETQLSNIQQDNDNLRLMQSQMISAMDEKLENPASVEGITAFIIADTSVPTTDEIQISENTLTETRNMKISSSEGYSDGIYTGSASGFGGSITVDVIISNGKLYSIIVTSATGEDDAYLSIAEEIIPKIIDAQSPEVDTISGATFSSTGIKNAVSNALNTAN